MPDDCTSASRLLEDRARCSSRQSSGISPHKRPTFPKTAQMWGTGIVTKSRQNPDPSTRVSHAEACAWDSLAQDDSVLFLDFLSQCLSVSVSQCLCGEQICCHFITFREPGASNCRIF